MTDFDDSRSEFAPNKMPRNRGVLVDAVDFSSMSYHPARSEVLVHKLANNTKEVVAIAGLLAVHAGAVAVTIADAFSEAARETWQDRRQRQQQGLPGTYQFYGDSKE